MTTSSTPIGASRDTVAAVLHRVRARLKARDLLHALALGLVGASAALTFIGLGRLGFGLALLVLAGALAFGLVRASRRTLAGAAASIEKADWRFQNVLITAEEVLDGRHAVTARVVERVCQDAASRLTQGAPLQHVTWHRPVGVLVAALGVSVGMLLARTTMRPSALASATPMPVATATDVDARPSLGLTVRLTPPPFTRQPPTTLDGPERIEAVEGTRLEVESASAAMTVSLNGTSLPVAAQAGRLRAAAVLSASGGLDVVASPTSGTSAEVRRLIPVTVTPDARPVATVRTPGRDLVVDGGRGTLAIALEASDDFQLESLRLRFTKVSGSGEQFDFREGDWPVAIDRQSETRWTARATVALSSLALEPGDLVAYRAVVRDGRGADGEAASDTYVLRVTQPGDVAAAGFAIDEDENKFALSQQMLLVKTERLHAERSRLAAEAFSTRVAALAAEQRMIRAEFVFMLGGHVEDEEEEAAHSNELQEGRLQNRGQRDVLDATRAMSRAERALTDADTSAALVFEREAIASLQRAFSRSRYLLRAMPVRAQLELERRLSGDLGQASGWRRSVFVPAAGSRLMALNAVVDDLSQLGSTSTASAATADRAVTLADTLLRLDVDRSAGFTDGAAALVNFAREWREGKDPDAAKAVSVAHAAIRRVLMAATAPVMPSNSPSAAPVLGALAEERSVRSPGGAALGVSPR